MNPFAYTRPTDPSQAVTTISGRPQSKFIGGGTNLVDLMKMGVETPAQLIDINSLPLTQIDELPDNAGVRLGALARNSDVANHQLVRQNIPSSPRLSSPEPVRSCATWPPSAAT